MRLLLVLLVFALFLLGGCIKYIVPECKDCSENQLDCQGRIIYKDELKLYCSCPVAYCVSDDNTTVHPDEVCTRDSDCVISGCSGQICGTAPRTSTCEFRQEYACLRQTTCGCQEGVCSWNLDNQAYQHCIDQIEETSIV